MGRPRTPPVGAIPTGGDLAGGDRHPQRHLDVGIESDHGDEAAQRRVQHEARRGGDDVVRALGAEPGCPAGSRRDAHGRAIAIRRDRWPEHRHRLRDAAGPAQRFTDDRRLGAALRGVVEMHPATTAATGATGGAGGDDTVCTGRHHVDHLGTGPVALLLGDLGHHRLTGQRSPDEHDPSVVVASDRVSPGCEAVRPQRHGWHRRDGKAGPVCGCERALALDERPATACVAGERSDGTVLVVALPIQIAPSVLPADFSRLGDEVVALEKAGVDLIQWDVMDGQFVPNLTFGPDIIASVRDRVTLPFEAHLMVLTPDAMAARYVEAGCSRLIVHAESSQHLHRSLSHVAELGASPGVAINPATPVSAVAHVLDLVDVVLVMTVNPGFGGQDYLPSMEPKIAELQALLAAAGRGAATSIEVDGGITTETAPGAVTAGASILVAGSALFRHEDGLDAAVAELRQVANAARDAG